MIHVGVLKTKWWLQNRSISDFWKRVVDTTTSFPTNCAIGLGWCWLWSFLSLGRKIFFLCDWKFVLDSLHPWERRVVQFRDSLLSWHNNFFPTNPEILFAWCWLWSFIIGRVIFFPWDGKFSAIFRPVIFIKILLGIVSIHKPENFTISQTPKKKVLTCHSIRVIKIVFCPFYKVWLV